MIIVAHADWGTDPKKQWMTIALCPFDGDLDGLLRTNQIVAVEKCPAEATIQIGSGVPPSGEVRALEG